MIDYEWIEKGKNIYDIVDEEFKITIKWSGKPSVDYLELSRQYAQAGYISLKEVIEVPHNNNIKYDMWFLPGVYMMRQAIELIIKAGIAISGATKKELETIFLEHKHNVKTLYDVCKLKYNIIGLKVSEQIWLEEYLDSIEVIDSNSDLFRYPFRDDFMQQYGNQSLDVLHMGNRLLYCYSTLNKLILNEWYDNDVLDLGEEPQFLCLTNLNYSNCYLWDSPWSDGFHKQIIGYSEVAGFLFDRFNLSKEASLFYPIVFLMRNAVEIALKRLLHIRTEINVDKHIKRMKCNSHLLCKDLWNSVKPVIIHYSREDNQDEETIVIAEDYITSLNKLDKNGDKFRYPCSYSCEYKFNNINIDVKNFYTYMLAIFHFIDSCDTWLDNIREIENDMRSEWESEMRSYMDDYSWDY